MNEEEKEFAVFQPDGTYVIPTTATKLTINKDGTGTTTTMDCRGITTLPYINWSDLSVATTSVTNDNKETKEEIEKVDKHIDELEEDIEFLAKQLQTINNVVTSQVKQIHDLENENTRLKVLIQSKSDKMDEMERLLQRHESHILMMLSDFYERKAEEYDKMS